MTISILSRVGAPWLLGCALMASGCLLELQRLGGDGYELDGTDRSPAPGATRCHPEALVIYRGTWLALQPPSQVAPAFAARLERFEEVLVQLGQQVYGRRPSAILHVGTYACRATEQHSARLSEHALGNAIDITGFRF